MNPERIEYFRTLLQERINELLGEADKTRNVMTGSGASAFPDPTDRAALETDRNFTLRIRDRERKLILNFENVRFMSSAFLGLLVKIHKRVIEMGGHLQLFNLDPKIQKVFEITQLTKVFDIA